MAGRLDGGGIVFLAADEAAEDVEAERIVAGSCAATRLAAGLAGSCETGLEASSSLSASSTSPRVMRVNSDSMPSSDT